MPNQDTSQIREKILSILRMRGPLLPVHIANETGLSMLFSSAFLSELLSDKKIRISYMKIGSSPIYFLPGHEYQLERYSHHLKSREKDAFLLLKEKKIIKDSKQEPAIRVALRSIRDFAMPFKRNNEIFWRYFTIPESEFREEIEPKKQEIIQGKEPGKREPIPEKEAEKPKIINLNILEKTEETKKLPRKSTTKRKPAQKKSIQNKNEKFFNQVKEFLSKEPIEILNIEGFGKDEILLRIKTENEEKLLIAYNKKKISENEIIKANKKASELSLRYIILSMGEPAKKLADLIDSVKNLEKIEKM
ncbi:MAG: hypothetical protein ABIE36_02190 [Candidatus Diapherotrites archaeon]